VTCAYVSVGSNIDPAENVRQALQMLARRVSLVRISTVYRTEPWGRPEQAPFYNCVVELEVDLSPAELRAEVLRSIEWELGRIRTEDEDAPRTIDLDLMAYGEMVVRAQGLTLPDPEIEHRPFLAIPFAELAPSYLLPGRGLRIEEVARAMSRAGMVALGDYTERLREEILHGDQSGAR
jgi:2-amino-4-hydroxy-6-hydroxymethyldihydropteridine diphosphokinase